MRSMSRTPTAWPASESERASCVVMLDLPTPPLPERTRMMFLTRSRDIFFVDLLINGFSSWGKLETFVLRNCSKVDSCSRLPKACRSFGCVDDQADLPP